MRHPHLAEDVYGELLEAADVDGPLFGGGQIAAADAEVTGRAHHPTGEPERVVAQDRFGRAVVILTTMLEYYRMGIEISN